MGTVGKPRSPYWYTRDYVCVSVGGWSFGAVEFKRSKKRTAEELVVVNGAAAGWEHLPHWQTHTLQGMNWTSGGVVRRHVLCTPPAAAATSRSSILKKTENCGCIIPVIIKLQTKVLPNMAELRAAHTDSRRDGHSCQPNGLAHGLEYASKLNASWNEIFMFCNN